MMINIDSLTKVKDVDKIVKENTEASVKACEKLDKLNGVIKNTLLFAKTTKS